MKRKLAMLTQFCVSGLLAAALVLWPQYACVILSSSNALAETGKTPKAIAQIKVERNTAKAMRLLMLDLVGNLRRSNVEFVESISSTLPPHESATLSLNLDKLDTPKWSKDSLQQLRKALSSEPLLGKGALILSSAPYFLTSADLTEEMFSGDAALMPHPGATEIENFIEFVRSEFKRSSAPVSSQVPSPRKLESLAFSILENNFVRLTNAHEASLATVTLRIALEQLVDEFEHSPTTRGKAPKDSEPKTIMLVSERKLLSQLGFPWLNPSSSAASSEESMSGGERPAPQPRCEYSSGVVTPCNKEVTVFRGPDYSQQSTAYPSSAFPEVQGALSSLGYRIRTVDLRPAIPEGASDEFNYEELTFGQLKSSQTAILNVHGAQDGSIILGCYDFPAYFGTVDNRNPECCDALSRVRETLGVDDDRCDIVQVQQDPLTDELVFPPPAQRSYSPVWVSAGSCERGREGPQCLIVADMGGLFGRHGTGGKAAIITTQCFAGRCFIGDASVEDFVQFSLGGFGETNGAFLDSSDKLLARDIRSDSSYCLDVNRQPSEGPGEPFSGESGQCSLQQVIYPGSPSTLRTLASSVELRGPGGGENGLQTHFSIGLQGDENTSVEFAPAVESVSYLEDQLTILGTFSSALGPNCTVEVKNSGSAKPTLSQNLPAASVSCGASEFKVILSGDPEPMSERQWSLPAQELRDIYGMDQTNWDAFIEIKVRGKAPNGIDLVGNSGSSQPIIWPVPERTLEAPYRFTNGSASRGGREFRILIPVVPSMACCAPTIDFVPRCGPPPGIPVQNGCDCAVTGKSQCFTGVCIRKDPDSGDVDTEVQISMPPESCEGGSYMVFPGDWKIWHDCGPVSVNGQTKCDPKLDLLPPRQCEVGQEVFNGIQIDYRIARPHDENDCSACETTELRTCCTEH